MHLMIFHNIYTPYRHALFKKLSGIHNCKVTVVLLTNRGGRDEWQLDEQSDTDVHYICLNRWKDWFILTNLISSNSRILYFYNGIQTYIYTFILLALKIFSPKLKSILWIEGHPCLEKHVNSRMKIKIWLLKLTQHMIDHTLCIGSDVANCFEVAHKNSDFSLLFQTSVSIPDVRPVNNELQLKNSFVYVGQLSDRKNISKIIELAGYLSSIGYKFEFIGRGPRDKDVKQLAKKCSLVNFSGFVSDKSTLFKKLDNHDFLILLSNVEPWGLVVNEALARGCIPIVSERCGSKDLLPVDQIVKHDDQIISNTLKVVHAITRDESDLLKRKKLMVSLSKKYTIDELSDKIYSITKNIGQKTHDVSGKKNV